MGGVVSHSAPIHPTSLVPGHQTESRTVHHHHHHHHTVAHKDRQLSDKIPSDSELPTGLFFFFFLDSNNHSTYYCSSL